ncbi:O-antigen ligase family protein [bacterium]|nr:O-antigen ligase family protein [bacterium]
MKILKFVNILLFITAIFAWCILAYSFAPPSFAYSAVFSLLCFIVFIATYRLPISGWWIFIALVPVINLPSRALMLGAHQALIFLSFAFVLGWIANKLITKRKAVLENDIAIPLFFIIFVGLGSGFWTALRFSDFYPIFTHTFKNGWVNASGVLASQAITHSILCILKLLIFPTLFIASYDIWHNNASSKLQLDKLFKKMITIWSIMLIPVIFTALYQNLFNPKFCMLSEVAWQEAKRVSGGMTDPNSLGLFLFMFIPAAVSYAISERGLRQILFVFSSLAGLYIITLTGSRSALLGIILVTSIVLLIIFFRALINHKSRKRILIISGVAFIIIFAIPFFTTGIIGSSSKTNNPLLKRLQHYTQRLSLSKSERIVDRREWQWKQAITMWKDYPFAGIGIGSFPIEISNYNLKTSMETPVDNAWNQYLHWLSETGIAGITFWIWFYAAFIWAIIKGIKSDKLSIWNLSVITVLSVLSTIQFLYIFGAHLQAPEVSVCVAVFSSFLLIFFKKPDINKAKLNRSDKLVLLLVIILIFVAQGYNALVPLSYDSVHKRYNLPYSFGFYNVEKWNNQFDYRWTQKFAGEKIKIPQNDKVILLKLAAINPNISKQNPKNITVNINGNYLDSLKVDAPDWREYEIYTFTSFIKPAELTFECDKTWQPGNEIPPRQLGFVLATNIIFKNVFSRDSQGLSDWYEENVSGRLIRYRYTGKRAALNIKIPESRVFKVLLRSPVNLRFYQKPISVTIKLNDKLLDTVVLPRNNREWLTRKFTANVHKRYKKNLLTITVDKLSTIRVKNSVKRMKIGTYLAIDFKK